MRPFVRSFAHLTAVTGWQRLCRLVPAHIKTAPRASHRRERLPELRSQDVPRAECSVRPFTRFESTVRSSRVTMRVLLSPYRLIAGFQQREGSQY